ncbi:hypothetical protein [Neorhizobium sp. S3-V5DH]|uniref:hypothetical protein n=1 Tax=Neorhizobium sp. S3-V5DH TaxID=2485166 RepID=UPI001049218B|nr:hypothetical protein [Neorhizobium sp. S3-V5DH]TCV66280.1 hypothetical protein EDE09_11630 [Neorhizobium sp. S3-V5DH]
MRLSSDKDDAGYAAWCHLNGDGKVARVFLDGIPQKDATMADDEIGEVRRCVRTAEGNLAVGHDEILMETVKGEVRIVIEDLT